MVVRLYYDDADSVRQKVIFARWAGLGGVAAWPVNMDNQVDLQKRKNDLLKGVIEGMNEDISVEFATKVAETSPTPPREAAGGISLISAEATQSSPVREASSARTSIPSIPLPREQIHKATIRAVSTLIWSQHNNHRLLRENTRQQK
ncbi:hypothetical protein MTO96_000954 [Rhipicephalus appendiculatus]